MSTEHRPDSALALSEALGELKEAIQAKYPDAAFVVAQAPDDDEGVDLITTVDIPDPDDVMDLVIDRVLAIQVERGLPVHVVPVKPLDRVIAEMAASKQSRR